MASIDILSFKFASEKAMCRSGFTTLSPELLQKQSVVFLLLERVLVSWSLAIDERGGYEDLRGSDRRSIIPYVHERAGVALLKPALPEPAFLSIPVKQHLSDPFIAQGRSVTLRPGARQVVPRWLKPYTTSRILIARSSK
jgi:hypothetical protein